MDEKLKILQETKKALEEAVLATDQAIENVNYQDSGVDDLIQVSVEEVINIETANKAAAKALKLLRKLSPKKT